MQQLKDFFARHNLRPFMTVYLALVHLYALFGMVYLGLHTETILKVFLALLQVLGLIIVLHGLYALGITAGSHRLWAHKSYHASAPLRFFLMLLNSGKGRFT